jgi:hypothetical protein
LTLFDTWRTDTGIGASFWVGWGGENTMRASKRKNSDARRFQRKFDKFLLDGMRSDLA